MVILKRTNEDNTYGVKVGGEIYDNFGYADDLALLTGSLQEMKQFMEYLITNAANFGLKLNFDKTKFMLIGPLRQDSSTLMMINNIAIKRVNTFKYLGRILSDNGNDLVEVQNRITKGWIAFNNKKSIITSRWYKKTYL